MLSTELWIGKRIVKTCLFIGIVFIHTYIFSCRLDSEVYDEDGNSLLSLDYDRDQVDVRNPPAVADDVYTLYYPPEKR